MTMGGYYVLLVAFSEWEKLLQTLYEYARHMSTVPALRTVRFRVDKQMKYEEYKQYFKDLGVNMAFDWTELDKLHAFRNAIAHHNGWVTPQNIKSLGKIKKADGTTYGYSECIEVSETYVRGTVQLVRETSIEFYGRYVGTLKNYGIEV
jgi:hypothetical protein